MTYRFAAGVLPATSVLRLSRQPSKQPLSTIYWYQRDESFSLSDHLDTTIYCNFNLAERFNAKDEALISKEDESSFRSETNRVQ